MKSFLSLCCVLFVGAARAAEIWPDYAGITVPSNIAPLNFDVRGAQGVVVTTLTGPGGKLVAHGVAVRFPPRAWHAFLAANKGTNYEIRVEAAGRTILLATNTVAAAPIDANLTYRLIPPSYTGFAEMGIYQRSLETFEERALYRNVQDGAEQCVNCHTYRQGDPGTYLFHVRARDAGTIIVSPKYGTRKVNLKVGPLFAGGVYPAWHPGGRYVAFSVNETSQIFYLTNPDKIEVMDSRSDLILYDLEKDVVQAVELDPHRFECFPSWSPDGGTLYSVAASVPDDGPASTNKIVREAAVVGTYTNLLYDLVARDFDAAKGTFSAPRTVIDAGRSHVSVTLPRVSPNGRWLIFTVGPQGVFHIWHKAADLWLLDLATGGTRPLRELNSPDVESYHTWSSNGEWLVFSSRRDDGCYTRPYFAHFDPQTGMASKPFILPVESPKGHLNRLCSYNIPEFSTGWVKLTPAETRRIVESAATCPAFQHAK